MSATISLRRITARRIDATLSFAQHSLIIVGLMLVLGTIKPQVHIGSSTASPDAVEQIRLASTSTADEVAVPPANETAPPVGPTAPEALPPGMQRVLNYVSRRYRVAPEALQPIFEAAVVVGKERRLDPLLIIAIIGIESRFNPFAESAVGAKGLMQVMPDYHQDKIPAGSGEQPFLHPVTNIQVGVHVLEEAIRWRGSLIAGLQHYGGASDDPDTTYANKVLAEKQRLEQAAARRAASGRV